MEILSKKQVEGFKHVWMKPIEFSMLEQELNIKGILKYYCKFLVYDGKIIHQRRNGK